jgi:hypothetical protein
MGMRAQVQSSLYIYFSLMENFSLSSIAFFSLGSHLSHEHMKVFIPSSSPVRIHLVVGGGGSATTGNQKKLF